MLPLVGVYDRWLANTTVGCFCIKYKKIAYNT
jgi:hypothetical protein